MEAFPETVWINGTFLLADDLHWSVDDRGLSLGDGLFETLRICDGKPRYFDAHWQRLITSAQALDMGKPAGGRVIFEAFQQLAKRANIEQGTARILFSRGRGVRGLAVPQGINPQVLLRVFPENTTTPPQPIRLALSKVRRHISQPSSIHKTISHLDMVMSRSWLENGARGNESLLLDGRGRLCCVGIGNLFWLRGNHLYTPSLSCAVLAGTTRERILMLAPELGLHVHEGAYWPHVLGQADTVFMSNAVQGLQNIQQVDLGKGDGWSFQPRHPWLDTLREKEEKSA